MTKSTIEKSLEIFGLFESDRLEWTTEAIAAELGLTRSTCYRYLKILQELGYVVGAAETGYTLGPRITFLEYHMRRKDPIIALCAPHAEAITQAFGGCAVVNRIFRDCFVCIHTVQAPDDTRTLQNRGDAIPLLIGANAEAIQAFLSRHRLKNLYDANAELLARRGRGDDFAEFRRRLLPVRRDRLASSQASFRADSDALAAPLLYGNQSIAGTFGFSFATGSLSSQQRAEACERIRAVGIEVSAALRGKPTVTTATG